MRYLPIILLLALVLMTAGCATTKQEVTPPQTTTIAPTPTPEPTLTRPLPGMDPIVGSWDNGMVFDADGYVGGDRNISWRANDMVKNSYFVTTETRAVKDEKSGMTIDPTATSIEWIYVPASDTIHKRDSTIGVRRVLPGTVPAVPVITTK